MTKEELKNIEINLKQEKEALEQELQGFAKEDKQLKGDWDTKYPCFDEKTRGSSLEEAANEVEEYANLLPIERALETKLKNINLALGKIKKNKYGICEICKKNIPVERLKVSPEAKSCLKCQSATQ